MARMLHLDPTESDTTGQADRSLAAGLSIVVPTRDEAANIPAFVSSLPEACRLIVVDDSRDETAELVRLLRPRASTVLRVVGNVSIARAAGADLVTTPWILFTDADIVFPPGFFRRLERRMADPRLDGCYGPKLSLDAHERYYRAIGWGQQAFDRLGIPAVSGSNLLVRQSAYAMAGGFDTDLSCNEDSELGWRLSRLGCRLRYAPELAVHARDHRRLRGGLLRKSLHTALRCSLLYLDVLPRSLRRHDWGYWSEAGPESGVAGDLSRPREA